MDFASANALNQAIRHVAQAHQRFSAVVFAAFGLHPGQALFLMELDAHGTRTQVQLAAALGVESPSITGMATRLQATGLITRTSASYDARAMIVELTATGRDLVPRVKDAWVQVAEATVPGMDAPSIDRLCLALTAMARSLSSDSTPRGPGIARGREEC